jgi:glycosyltransferase involved in cell wall biosynthesis
MSTANRGGRRIAMIVSPWYPVPPNGYGGIEMMAFLLARELTNRGNDVTILGSEGSCGPFDSIAVAPTSWSGDLGLRDETARQCLFLHRAYEMIDRDSFDVVHDHSGLVGLLLAANSHLGAPVVATLHGDLTEADGEFLATVDQHVDLVAISRSQQALVNGVAWRRVIHNAVDPSGYGPVVRPVEKHDFLLQLARISPTKGQHIAIEVAMRLGMPLVLAGKVDHDSTTYFNREIKPHLGSQVLWRPNVMGDEKRRLLRNARAMIFPIQWEEPFGMAMVESMVSGTPVIALSRGAAREIIDPGITGWVAEDADGMVDAFHRIDEIDLRRCAAHAAARFAPHQMAENYEAVYDIATGRATSRTLSPVASLTVLKPSVPDEVPIRPA